MNDSTQAFHAARDLLFEHRENYEAAVEKFQWPQLTHFNWALDHFDVIARDNQAPALHIVEEDGSQCIRSFAEMSARSNQVANFLRELGVRRGDRLLLVLGNEVALWESMLAAFKLGAVVIPATALLTASDLDDRILRGRVRHVIAGSSHAAKFAQVAGDYTRICVGPAQAGWQDYRQSEVCVRTFTPDSDTRATDPLLLYFTSGTTSKPKLVLHTHESYPVGHLSTMYWLGLRPGDVHLNISSPGWAKHAWSCLFAPWNAGACVFLHNVARFNALGLLNTLAQHGVTSLCAPPTVWRMLIQEDLAAFRGRLRLREVIGAGEPLNPEVIDQVRNAWGLTLRDGFGQTETTAQIGNSPGQKVKAGSMGRPLPGYQVALLDVDDRESNEGEVSLRLDPRPLGLMQGYEDSAEKTSEVMRGGYYRTGDVAMRDSEGYITFVGRADDVFKASDYRISPFELESVLLEHPAIAEAAVVPSPDPIRLAVPKAFVVLAAGQAPSRELAASIFAYAREQLAPYKRIRRIEFTRELPKTISGKIRRVDLRKGEVAAASHSERAPDEYVADDFA